jgi:hypothetical protein
VLVSVKKASKTIVASIDKLWHALIRVPKSPLHNIVPYDYAFPATSLTNYNLYKFLFGRCMAHAVKSGWGPKRKSN